MNPLKMLSRGGAVSEPSDADFENVTLLLHGDGTNGAQNNTFLDSSTNNFTITRNGNTTQGTFSPFSKVDGRWGNYFDGDDNLNFANSSNFAFGTGAFTIEFWINGPANNDRFILGGRSAIGTMHITTGGTGSTGGTLRYVGSSTISSGSTLIVDNQWHHCAIVRDGSSNITLYVDGVSRGTGTDTTNYTSTGGTWYVGQNDVANNNYLVGYLSNLRIVKGTAVYTTGFTPPTAPLTAISNTSLLTCQSNRFRDNSGNNVGIGINGSTKVTPFSPFPTLTAYDAATNGGSGYFDGSGDYLTVADAAALELSNSNFCIECWINTTSSTQYDCIVAREDGSTASGRWAILINNASATAGDVAFWSTDFNGFASAMLFTTGVSIRDGAWHHIALVRNGSSWVIYIDGVSRATQTSSITIGDIGIAYWIGNNGGTVTRDLPGYLSGFRYVVGSAVYTSAFTPPTAPPTAITNTSLLLNFTNAGIIDNSMSNNLETVGNAQIDTTTKKYGTGAMEFDGTGDYLFSPSSDLYAVGSGNFTIEFWIYSTTNFTLAGIGLVSASYTTNFHVYGVSSSGNKVGIWVANSALTSTNNISLNTWTHLAFVRNNGTVTIYIDGVSSGSSSLSGTGVAAPLYVGTSSHALAETFTGFIDDLRITKGKARYTSNFTPPTAALPDIGE